MPNDTQPPPAPDRPYVVTLRLDSTTPVRSTWLGNFGTKIGVVGDQPGKTENGRVRLYVIGQGALGAAAQTSTKQDIAAAERWNLPIVLIVRLSRCSARWLRQRSRWRWGSSPSR